MAMDERVVRIAPVQVTTWGVATDKDLMSWFGWYKKRGTPAAVVRREAQGRTTAGVSVWRYGKTDSESHDVLRAGYMIDAECHGFSKMSERKGGSHGA